MHCEKIFCGYRSAEALTKNESQTLLCAAPRRYIQLFTLGLRIIILPATHHGRISVGYGHSGPFQTD